MSFNNWRARLNKTPVKTFLQPDALDEGYYRKPIVERLPNGKWKTLGYEPVAYFLDGNRLVGLIGGREMTEQEVGDEHLWSWVCTNAIPYEWYQAVAERGEEWPDKDKWTSIVPPVESSTPETAKSEEGIAESLQAEPPKPRHEVLSASIRVEIEAAPKVVASDEDVAEAEGAKNKLAELRLAAKREGEAEYKPFYNKYTALQKLWKGVMDLAEGKERELQKAILTFREQQRQKAAAEAAEAARKQREIDEANQRAADRAIANGHAEPPPVVVAAPAEASPAPARPAPTYGKRTTREEVKKFAVINDWAAVFAHFQTDAELRARLEKLATDAIRAGGTVPGATYREGLI